MRILHTSDWHIGRTFHGHSTLDALRGVLEALVRQVADHDVDVVIVAGDVFDSAVPSAASYALLSDALRGLADTGARVVVTSGNHDSAARLGFNAGLLRDGVHIVTDARDVGVPITIDDAHGPVHFYGIPYLEPALLRHVWPSARSQEGALIHAMDLVRADLATRPGRSVVVSHCFAAGVEPTPHLERDIQQGGLDIVPLATFDGPDYVALGHIHGRSRLSDRVRYSGAPLHYSFGEAEKPRGSWLVGLDASGLASVEWLDLPVPRRLVRLSAPLADILGDPAYAEQEDAWVGVAYTDELPQRDPLRRIQERFPHCAMVEHTPAGARERVRQGYAERVRAARSDRELVDLFLAHVREGEGTTEREGEILADVLAERTRAEAVA